LVKRRLWVDLRHSPRLIGANDIEANPDDPEYTPTISAPTNADARQIGKDIRVLDAIDRTGESTSCCRWRSATITWSSPIGLSGAARRVTKSAGCAHIRGDDSSTGTTDNPDLQKRAVRRSRMALRFQV